MRARSWLIIAVSVLAVLLLVGRAVSALVVDLAWFKAMGAPGVFWEQLIDQSLLQGISWIAGSLFAFVNLHGVRRTIREVAVPSRVANLELTAMIPSRRLLWITILASAVIGLVLALPMTDWTSVAMARHGIPFGEIEGVLDRDLGFYVYRLPLEEGAYLWALATLVLVVTIVLVLYALTRSLRVDGRRLIASTHVRRHLSALGAMVLLLLAWSYRLDSFDVLQRGSGPDYLFLKLDHIVILPVDAALAVLCAISAPVFFRAGWLGQIRAAFITLSIVLVGAIGARHVLPILIARSDLLGEPSRRDQSYLTMRTLHSRRAYDVDGIRVSNENPVAPHTSVKTRVRVDDLAASLSLWEPDAVRTRRDDGGSATIDAGAPGWIPGEDGRVTALVVRRPVSGTDRWSVALADVTQPMVRDSVLDFDVAARTGVDNATNSDGEPMVAPGLSGHRLVANPAGVLGTPLRSLGSRVAHAWATRDPSLLDADTVTGPSPRLVAHRDVRTRLARLTPVLVQGSDIQPILWDGALLWAVTLYSASDHYPLSQRWNVAGREQSYFRLAATALIDAATGRVRVVPVERPDPVARTWFARIPSIVVPMRDVPAGLIDRFPTASDGAVVQARTFARYGSRLEGAITRHAPDTVLAGNTPPMHLVASALGRVAAWSIPLLDSGDQLDGVITAVGGRYRATYWDSTSVPRARWSALTEKLRAALDTARAGAADGTRREPRMRLGNVQLVPGENGPVLVQPLIWNRADGAPIISRVAVLDGSTVVVAGTIGGAVAMLRGQPPARDRSLAEWPLLDGVARDERIARLYENMRDAMRRGEWTRFGAAFDSLGLVVGKPPQ